MSQPSGHEPFGDAVVLVAEWPAAERELSSAGYRLRRGDLDELAAAELDARFVLIDVDRPARLEAGLALLERNDGLLVAFYASPDTAMLSRVARAMSRGLSALFIKPADSAALPKKLQSLGVFPTPLRPATLPSGANDLAVPDLLAEVPEAAPSASPSSAPLSSAAASMPHSPVVASARSNSLPPMGMRGSRPSPAPSAGSLPELPRIPPLAPIAHDAFEPPMASRPQSLLTALSPELRGLLLDAEERAGALDEEFALPSPEEELEAVLPQAVLDALDDPLELSFDEDDLPPSLRVAGHDADNHTTGVRGDTTGVHGDRMPRRVTLQPRAHSSNPDAIPTPRPSARRLPSSRGQESAHASEPTPRPAPLSSDPELSATQHASPRLDRQPPPAPASRHRVEPQVPVRRGSNPRVGTVAPPTPQASTRALAAGRETPVSAEGQVVAALAQAAAQGFDGVLELRDESGVRVVRFLRGDIGFAASYVAGESLVDFLAVRGEMSKEKATRLARRMPAFGRFAGAALVANGVVAKDDMWTVLRAHSAFVLERMALVTDGTLIEAFEAGRIADEPPVFGASTGAEVVLEVVLRTVPVAEARSRLGGARGLLVFGPNKALMAECGLDEDDALRLEQGEGRSIDELLRGGRDAELLPVLYGLSLLGVVEVVRDLRDHGDAAAEREPSEPRPPVIAAGTDDDAFDDEALRAAIVARTALVEEGDYFAVLGVARSATGYEIRRAFLELRQKFEPARALRARTLDLKPSLDRILDVLDEAYEILRDTPRRERYLRALSTSPE